MIRVVKELRPLVRAAIAALLGGTRGAALRVELEADDRRQAEREARPGRLRAERAALLARLAEIDAELGGAA